MHVKTNKIASEVAESFRSLVREILLSNLKSANRYLGREQDLDGGPHAYANIGYVLILTRQHGRSFLSRAEGEGFFSVKALAAAREGMRSKRPS